MAAIPQPFSLTHTKERHMNATPTIDEQLYDFANAKPRDMRGRLEGDEQLMVRFFKKAVLSELKTKEEGRPIYDDLDHILIVVPGDDKIRIETIVTPEHAERFMVEFKQFKENGEVAETGTPLEQWAALSPAQVAEFKHFQVRTVEQLAGMADSTAQKFPGINNLRERAKHYLKTAADSAIVERQDAELAKRDAEIAELRKMIEGLANKGGKRAAE